MSSQSNVNISLIFQSSSEDEDNETKNGTMEIESAVATANKREAKKRKRSKMASAFAPQHFAPEPSSSQPSTSQPSTSQPSTSQPSTSQTSTSQPSASHGTSFVDEEASSKTPTAAVVASDYIYYKGNYMQVGDVVSIDDTAGGTFYAQIGSFLTDRYAEKRALITWLLPTGASPHPSLGFEPATYVIGPEDDTPHKLEYMQFVMHLPTNYYKDRNTLFPVSAAEADSSSIEKPALQAFAA